MTQSLGRVLNQQLLAEFIAKVSQLELFYRLVEAAKDEFEAQGYDKIRASFRWRYFVGGQPCTPKGFVGQSLKAIEDNVTLAPDGKSIQYMRPLPSLVAKISIMVRIARWLDPVVVHSECIPSDADMLSLLQAVKRTNLNTVPGDI